MEFFRASPSDFIEARDRLSTSLRAYLTPFTAAEYVSMDARLYLSEDALCGFAVNPDGCLHSLFSIVRGRGEVVALAAIAHGARSLDCLGEHLRLLYERVGFRVTCIGQWSDAVAQPGWDYDRFGRPNYYELTFCGS